MNKEKIFNLPSVMQNCKMYIHWNSRISGIYAWINKINGKMYIGKSKNLYKRIYDEMNGFKNNRHQNMFKLYNSIKKYGMDNFKVVLLLECPVKYLNKIEMWLIKYYDTKTNGYNITDGGDGVVGYMMPISQIKRQTTSLKHYWTNDKCKTHSEKMKNWFNLQTKDIQEKIRSGNNWWLNKKYKETHLQNVRKSLSPERIEKQRKSLLEYYKNNTSKKRIVMNIISPTNKIVKINGIRTFCNEYKLNINGIQNVINGKISYYKGWHLLNTPSYIPKYEKIRGPDGKIYTFTSITKFCKEHNIDKGNLRKILNGIGTICKGFTKI